MDVGRYRHNYEGFYEKITYHMFINRGITITTQGAHASLIRILSFLLFLSLVTSFEEEIQLSGDRMDTAKG